MSFALFNENTRRYGVILQETSELRVEQPVHQHSTFTHESIRCTVSYTLNDKIALHARPPKSSLAEAIISYAQCRRMDPPEVHDVTGRIWIIQGCTTTARMGQPGWREGRIELMAPMPIEIDKSMIQAMEPINFVVNKITLKAARDNLLRGKGPWKCT